MKPVMVNGRCFTQATIEQVQYAFGKVAKKIIEFKTMISIVI